MIASVEQVDAGMLATPVMPQFVPNQFNRPPALERSLSLAATSAARSFLQGSVEENLPTDPTTGLPSGSSHPSDMTEYVRRIADGDENTFELLHRCYAPFIRGLAIRLLVSPADAEEVLQDVFLELWRNPPRAEEGVRSLLAWMTAVTKTRCWQKIRSERRQPNQSADTDDAACVHSDDVFYGLLRDELENMLQQKRDRILFRLLYREGMGATEAARFFGVPVVTVRKRRASLIGKLRKVVNPCDSPQSTASMARGLVKVMT